MDGLGFPVLATTTSGQTPPDHAQFSKQNCQELLTDPLCLAQPHPPAFPLGLHNPGEVCGQLFGSAAAYADAPEIDGVVRLLPPEKISKTLKVGEFTKARIVAAQGHDLVAVPI